MTTRWSRFGICTLFLSLVWAQNKAGDAAGANAQARDLLDLRGDLPNPRRIGASELHKLPRAHRSTFSFRLTYRPAEICLLRIASSIA